MGHLTRSLPVELTNAEIQERAKEQARLLREIAGKEEEKKDAAARAGEYIKILRGKCMSLAEEIDTGLAYREVEVREARDYDAGEVSVYREDTGEVIESRPMTSLERQTEIITPGTEMRGVVDAFRRDIDG